MLDMLNVLTLWRHVLPPNMRLQGVQIELVIMLHYHLILTLNVSTIYKMEIVYPNMEVVVK